MVRILATTVSLLLYISGTYVGSETTDTTIEKSEQAIVNPSYTNPSMVDHPSSEDNQLKKDKPFGGDRSDLWLYPPRSYYIHWVDTEEEKDKDQWWQWQEW